MVFERPKRPGQSQSKPQALQRNNYAATQRPQPQASGGGRAGNPPRNPGQGGPNRNHPGGNNEPIPSPWLEHPLDPQPDPDSTASFVEYLRWMREVNRNPNKDGKDSTDPNTKVQIMQMAMGQDYHKRLEKLHDRTQLIAGQANCFEVTSSWRIRVGGHRGPESILLPAFDALGMPYIPSSTLRGVARTQAIREIMERENITDWREAEKRIAPYFGSLDAKDNANKAGKVIFLDAYPMPSSKTAGLEVDMANNIWNWGDGNNLPGYSPNPNPFFSLKKSKFLIGIKQTGACDVQTFNQVKKWLIQGLAAGIGSQVNTGYGVLSTNNKVPPGFFRVDFTLEGQLIHSQQKIDLQQPFKIERDGKLKRNNKGELVPNTASQAEVRSVAFKSMLRYWFRAFTLGVMPVNTVKELEAEIFGDINIKPKPKRGYLIVRIENDQLVQMKPRPNQQGRQEACGKQLGTLVLDYSTEVSAQKGENLAKLSKSLTWLMFHLGGIGQGARRPCYSRQNRNNPKPPWWRGATLKPERNDNFWELPKTPQAMHSRFRQHLDQFYQALSQFTQANINPRNLRPNGVVRNNQWKEAIDAHCRILVCSGREDYGKPYALAQLHHPRFKQGNYYDGNLCGQVGGPGGVKPSPVWIADLEHYQIVTVFGATEAPRSRFIEELNTNAEACFQIFPFT
ncbi:RAMP superfamily CRISPR-associated protein [Synechococcus sp. PCC 6312]|uniref:RAMP superfamily CRISPR-associated protein n=1 Tax=Synechococcus sp. (strain ATCC 27167 / PCC 6312) TaxID=195253 RepID=UPI00029ED119|nr:RAMP superfamily CRISPR-associated protein [Synechococcus sp. PCC 6312]AFY61931.1 uncharacterized protein predicted to be involved in DNA repair (RAMP superfamily) [Synechococcus sp. PCC 6312]